jgi:hypothetical protein
MTTSSFMRYRSSALWAIMVRATQCPSQTVGHVETAGIAERSRKLEIGKGGVPSLFSGRARMVRQDQSIGDRLYDGDFVSRNNATGPGVPETYHWRLTRW